MKSLTSSVIGKVLSPLMIALLLQGCGPQEGIRSQEESLAIDEYVDSLGKLDVPAQSSSETTPLQVDQPSQSPSGESLLCSVAETREIKLIDNFTSQGAVAKRIYPGVLFDGDSLDIGAFNEIPLPKKPLTISIDLPQRTTATVMENPSLSAFRNAQQELIFAGLEERAGEPAPLPKNFFSDILATVNEDQLSLTLGFDVKAGIATNVDVAGQFNFNDTNKRSRYLLRIVNELYTVAIDKPASPSEFFAESVSLEAVQNAFRAGNPPVYVDTITYGRVIYVAVESSFSASELQAALQVAVSGVGFDVNTEFGISSQAILQEASVKSIGLGLADGDVQDLGSIQGVEDLGAFARLSQRLASVSAQTFGEPISFSVAYLTDNSKTVSSVEGTYTTESCRLAGQAPPEEIRANVRTSVNRMVVTEVKDTGLAPNQLEIFGTIVVVSGGKRVVLFEQSRENTVTFSVGTFSGNLPFWKSGTLQDLDLTPGQSVRLEINLFEKDPASGNPDDAHILTRSISAEQILSGALIVPFSFGANGADDGVFRGQLHLDFQLQ